VLCFFPVPALKLPSSPAQLVQRFEHFGLLPDYECDLTELDAGATYLRRQLRVAADALTPAAEASFAKLNITLSDLNRSLQTGNSELQDPRANRQLQVTGNCSAVSTACMLTRREIFQKTGGFDETLERALADVDLCLKMRRAGYLIVSTPFAKTLLA
jgi:hypothetical protein